MMATMEIESWGGYTLLLTTEDEEVRAAYEKVSRSMILGQYDEAEGYFQTPPLVDSKSLPVILERANMLERMGRERDKALFQATNFEELPYVESETITEAFLIRLDGVIAEMPAFGHHKTAFLLVEEAVDKLKKKQLEEYNNLEIYSAIACHQIFRNVKAQANWMDPEEDEPALDSLIPTLTAIRRLLQARGDYSLAMALVRPESAWSPSGQDLAPFEEVLEVYRDNIDSISHLNVQTQYKIALTKIFYAEVLHDNARDEDARKQLDHAMTIKNNIIDASLCSSVEMERLQLLHDRTAITLLPPQNPFLMLQEHQSIADRAKKTLELAITRVHLRATITVAEAIYDFTSPVDKAPVLSMLQQLLDQYLTFEKDQALAFYQISAITTYGLRHCSLRNQHESSYLAMIIEFCNDFPNFSPPKSLANMLHAGYRTAQSIGDEETAMEFHKLYKEVRSESSDYKKSTNKTKSVLKETGDANFYLEWELAPDSKWLGDNHGGVCAKLILRWLKSELEQKLISPEGAYQLINGPRDMLLDFNPETFRIEDFPDQDELKNRIYGTDPPAPKDKWNTWFELLAKWLKEAGTDRPSTQFQRDKVLIEALNSRKSLLGYYSTALDIFEKAKLFPEMVEVSRACIEMMKSLTPGVISERDRWSFRYSFSNTISAFAVLTPAKSLGGLTDDMLVEAIATAEELELEAESLDDLYRIVMIRQCIASLKLRRWDQFGNPGPETCLKDFDRAEKAFNKLRMNHSMLNRSYTMVTAKTYNTDRTHPWVMYLGAIRASLAVWVRYMQAAPNKAELDNVENTDAEFWRLSDQMIDWVQRSKARTMVELLGPNIALPSSILNSLVESNSQFAELAEEEKSLLQRYQVAPPFEQLHIREEIEVLRTKIRKLDSSIDKIISMREGIPISTKELEELGKEFGPDVVMIDWVKNINTPFSIFLIIYRNGRFRHIAPITEIQIIDVKAWIKDYLQDEEPLKHSSAARDLAYLAPLIKPILQFTNPGETLVFCPTNELHQIPLHAIKIPGTNLPLIERNPIVYIQSLSLLRLCHMEQASRKGSRDSVHAVLFNTLSDPDDGAETTGKVRELLNAVPFANSEVTKENFAIYGQLCDIIHLHGHIYFPEPTNEEDDEVTDSLSRLEHHIVFPTPEEPKDKQDEPKDDQDELKDGQDGSKVEPISEDQDAKTLVQPSDPTKLTLSELFDMELHRPSLVVAMGCNSSRSHYTGSDDLLGLSAALHCAGASAVLGTLWPVHRGDCIDFSMAFYEDFFDQVRAAEPSQQGKPSSKDDPALDCENAGEQPSLPPAKTYQPIVNLAQALQQAVITIGKDESTGKWKSPYHWAGFMLHGSWMFHLGEKDISLEETATEKDEQEAEEGETESKDVQDDKAPDEETIKSQGGGLAMEYTPMTEDKPQDDKNDEEKHKWWCC